VRCARRLEPFVGPGFVEVFVECSAQRCQERDVKGLYAKAKRGELWGLTGFDAPYEEPEAPELVLETAQASVQECVERVKQQLGWR